MKHYYLASLALAASCAGTSAADPKKAKPENKSAQGGGMQESYKKLVFPAVEEFKPTQPVVRELSNGTLVYLMVDHELPVVRMRAMIRAAAAYEPADKVGLAAVAAQTMRTGGTTKNPGDKLDDELGALAASIDVGIGPLSGSASASCLSEKLPRVLELFADVLRNPSFPQEKIELAKTALRTAISRRNDQIGAMAGRAFQIAMYGKDSVLAREPEYATVDAIERADLVKFHDQWFRADRVALGFVGSFDSEELIALLERHFGDWKRAESPLPQLQLDPHTIDGRHVFFAEKNDVNQTNLMIGTLGMRRDDPDWAAIRVGSFVLGAGGFSSRMMKKVRTELGLAYSVGGGMGAEFDRPGLFRAVCQTKSGSTAQAIDAILGEIDGMLRMPPTEAEVQLAKDQILNAEVFEYETRAGILGRRMTLDYYKYPPDFLEQLNRRIRAVKPADVAAAWKRHLNPKNLNIVAVGNEKEFDKPLSTFGPVAILDLSIPEAKAKAAPMNAEASAKGAQAVDALLAKSGGRDAWKALKSSKSEYEFKRNQPPIGEVSGKGKTSLVLPNKMRSDIEANTPMGTFEIVRVICPEGSWIRQPGPPAGEVTTQSMSAEQVKQVQSSMRTDYTLLLSHLAAGDFQASVAEGKLVIADHDALVATLTLDGEGRIATIEYPASSGDGTATRTLSDYKEAGGLFFPFAQKIKDGAIEQETTLAKVEVNASVEDSAFAKPKEEKEEDK